MEYSKGLIMTDEIVDQVDKKDNIIGECLKSECHKKWLWHRGAAVFVFNKKGELLIQKRSPNVRRPNLLSTSAAGHLSKGDLYLEGAKRELSEELGISVPLKFIGKMILYDEYPNGEIEREHYSIYICKYDGEMKIQKEEVTSIKFYPIAEIKRMIKENKDQFTPGFLQEFQYYMNWKKKNK